MITNDDQSARQSENERIKLLISKITKFFTMEPTIPYNVGHQIKVDRQRQYLRWLLQSFIPLSVTALLFTAFNDPNYSNITSVIIMIPLIVGLPLFGLILNSKGYYNYASLLTVLFFEIGIIAGVILFENPNERIYMYFMLPIILSIYLFSISISMIVLTLNIAAIIILDRIFTQLADPNAIIFVIMYSTLSFIFFTLAVHSQNLLRKDHIKLISEKEKHVNYLEKMESIGQLSSGIVHNFNNILTVIKGYSELLQSNLKDNLELSEMIDEILKASTRAKDLNDKLLMFSKQDIHEFQPVDIHEIIDEITILAKNTFPSSIEITSHKTAEFSIIWGDRSSLFNILLNLIVNSRDAIDGRGSVNISTRLVASDISETSDDETTGKRYLSITNQTTNSDMYIQISVSDTGCGISKDDMKHLFTPYFTTKRSSGGTGLGLASVYGSIKSHNGAIYVESNVGQGTVFYLTLPINIDR